MLIDPNGRVKQRLVMSAIQMACILGLERLLSVHGLVLTCPRCADEGQPLLDTDNDPHAPLWKINCGCKERRIERSVVGRAMDSDGELVLNAEQILSGLSLAVRCGQRRCLRHPLDIYRAGEDVVVTCRCAKTTFHPPRPTVH